MITVFLILGIAALVMTLVHAAIGKVPLWVPVFVLAIIECLRSIPLGH